MSKEITVLPRNSESGVFSRPGDSGSAVIDDKGSAGNTDESDCAYFTVLTSIDFLCKRIGSRCQAVKLSRLTSPPPSLYASECHLLF